MATTHNLTFCRFVCQTATGVRPKSSYLAMQSENLEALKACVWKEASAGESAALTPHDFTRSSYLEDRFDAFKMTGSYDSSAETEVAFAGMAAYRFKLPADYKTGSATLASVTLPVSRDRFLKSGLHLAAAVSDSETPSTDWDTVRGSSFKLESQLTQASVANIKASAAADAELTLSLTDIDGTKCSYLWIYITLEDYTDTWSMYSAKEARLYAIEGSAMLVGSATAVTFSTDVAADSSTTEFTVANKASLPHLYGGDSAATGVFAFQRMANGSPFASGKDPVATSSAAVDVAGLAACYAALKSGGGEGVPAALCAPSGARPGAGFAVEYVTGGKSAGWRITASALLVPCVMPDRLTPSKLRLAWDATAQSGGKVNVWMKRGAYVTDYPASELAAAAIWDASSSKSGDWEHLGTIGTVSSASSAEIALPQMSCNFVTFLFTAYLPIDDVNLSSATWPQGVGSMDADVINGVVTGLHTGFIPTLTLIG